MSIPSQPIPLLRVWGAGDDIVARNHPPDAVENPNKRSGPLCYWFATVAEAMAFADKLRHEGFGNVIDSSYNDHTNARTVAYAEFEYQGKNYIHKYDFGFAYEKEDAIFIFVDGNYACDCNRSNFIRQQDKSFPDLDCGEKIRLSKIEIKYELQGEDEESIP